MSERGALWARIKGNALIRLANSLNKPGRLRDLSTFLNPLVQSSAWGEKIPAESRLEATGGLVTETLFKSFSCLKAEQKHAEESSFLSHHSGDSILAGSD